MDSVAVMAPLQPGWWLAGRTSPGATFTALAWPRAPNTSAARLHCFPSPPNPEASPRTSPAPVCIYNGNPLPTGPRPSLLSINPIPTLLQPYSFPPGDKADFSSQVAPLRAAAPSSMRFVLVTATMPQHTFAELRDIWPEIRTVLGPGLHRTAAGGRGGLGVRRVGASGVCLARGAALVTKRVMKAMRREGG
jgi:hypothetical protein